MRLRVPIGQSGFGNLRRGGFVYVDKTHFVSDVLQDNALVLLFPRPRRFGKTLNLSTLRRFVERPRAPGDDRSGLFEGLRIWEDQAARAHFQRHPVIALTFKDVKPASWEECAELLVLTLRDELVRLHPIWREAPLEPAALEPLVRLLNGEQSLAAWSQLLRRLSEALAAATGERVVLLIDEYDSPLHAAWVHGFYEEAVGFFRTFLSAGLKDNPHLFKGVVTGILRIGKESLFSGLNNLRVHSLLSPTYTDAFGFTEAEVASLLEAAGLSEQLPGVRAWYNGYRFGDTVIYNPWSVLSFLDAPEEGFVPHWLNTSSNDLVYRLLTRGDPEITRDVEALLEGRSIEKSIDENLVLREVDTRSDAVWSLLLFSGYLKPAGVQRGLETRVTLVVPNREVASIYHLVFRDWLSRGAGGSGEVQALTEAMLRGDARGFGARLQDLVLRSLSYLDATRRAPEAVYHAFAVGLLVHLQPRYRVWSNREAGYGRADVLVVPAEPGQPGAVLELKRLWEEETPEHALEDAMAQLQERDDAAVLREGGRARGRRGRWCLMASGYTFDIRRSEFA